MSLVPDYENSSNSSSSSSSDSEEIENTKTKESQVSLKNKLPTPSFGMTSTTLVEELTKSSVFKNPFAEAENAKEAILQKHVKMVEAKDNVVIINGKRICWNYRKGRCRFGHKCKYAHDSDIQKSQEQIEVETTEAIKQSVICESNQTGINPKHIKSTATDSDNEDKTVKSKQKRKRPGLTQGLVPGKKVMKQYLNQKT